MTKENKMLEEDIRLEKEAGMPPGFGVFLAKKLFFIEHYCQRNYKKDWAQEILKITSASPSQINDYFIDNEKEESNGK